MKFSSASLVFISFSLIYFKTAAYVAFQAFDLKFFGGGSDSDYYHAYAIGEASNAVNLWPVVLRFLNDLSLYDRDFFSYFIFSLNIIFIPLLVHSISVIRGSLSQQRNFLVSYAILAVYPTLFVFTLDIYRDLVMVAVFLLATAFLRTSIEKRISVLSLLAFFALCYVAFLFRPYLGAAMALSYLVFRIYSKTSRYLWGWFFMYVSGLLVAQSVGVFDAVTAYRGVDGFSGGGATLGIGLHGRDPFTFIALYFYSFIAQILGLYFPNASSVLVFFLESVPFMFLLLFVIRNRLLMNRLCHYLVVFFIIYTTVWVVGNDNLGTAVRLRMPSYLAILICFLIVSQKKKVLQRYFATTTNSGH